MGTYDTRGGTPASPNMQCSGEDRADAIYHALAGFDLAEEVRDAICERMEKLIDGAERVARHDGAAEAMQGVEWPLDDMIGARDIEKVPPTDIVARMGHQKGTAQRLIVSLAQRLDGALSQADG